MAERPKMVEMDLNRASVQRDAVLLADLRILTERDRCRAGLPNNAGELKRLLLRIR